MKLKRMLTVLGVAIATIIGFSGVAAAHTPVMLDETDVLPWEAPLAVDGTNEILFLGVLPAKGAVRSFQLNLTAGQTLRANVYVPNQAPENTLATSKQPW